MKKKRWSQEEIDTLKKLYPTEPDWDKILRALPNRTRRTCGLKAHYLDLHRPYRIKDRWTDKEIKTLTQLYTTEPDWDKILQALPNRNRATCIQYASVLRLTRTSNGVSLGKQQPIPISPIQAAYLAGVLDCDGTISLKTMKRKSGNIAIVPYIGVYNTNKQMVNWCKNVFDQHVKTTFRTRQMDSPNHKPLHHLKIHGMAAVARVLRAIMPYLVQKTRQAEIVLNYCENHEFYTPATPQELELVKAIRPLNRRGNPKNLL